jgi:uncharacterized protein YbaP (TraB family)
VAGTKLRRLLALGLLGGLSTATLCAQAAAPVWVIRGPHAIVYLAGSVHLLPAQSSTLPAAFDHAYSDSKKLVMEMDMGKIDALAVVGWMTEHGTLPEGTTLRSLVGDARYQRVSAAAGELNAPVDLLNGQAPWVVGLELADLQYMHEGFDPQQGVEEQLVRRAQADAKATDGLETIDEELSGLEGLSREDQLRLLDQTLDDLKEPQQEMQEILTAWRHGDAAQLAALLSREYRAFPALYRPLVTVRNQRWVPKIEQLLNGNENCLVVVGALHLVGDGGLLELLRRDGFTASQLN